MGFCGRCGRQLDGSMQFCPGCGQPTAPQPQVQSVSTRLCDRCGRRLDNTMANCPDCGAPNLGNPQIVAQFAHQVYAQNRSEKSFSIGFSVVSLIGGIFLFLVHIFLLTLEPPTYLIWEVFVGAASSAMVAVFSIIGLAKKEPVTKAIVICGGASLWALFMYAFLSF